MPRRRRIAKYASVLPPAEAIKRLQRAGMISSSGRRPERFWQEHPAVPDDLRRFRRPARASETPGVMEVEIRGWRRARRWFEACRLVWLANNGHLYAVEIRALLGGRTPGRELLPEEFAAVRKARAVDDAAS